MFIRSGGLSNYLYLCSLPADRYPDVYPNTVLLRLYGPILQDNPDVTVTLNSVIFTLLAEKGMGPKLFGIFNGGRLEEYLPVFFSVCPLY